MSPEVAPFDLRRAIAARKRRSRSARLGIGLSEVVADEEQRFIQCFGERVHRTVAHIELRWMALAFSIALERVGRQARLGFIERHDDDLNFFEEAMQLAQQCRMFPRAHDYLSFEQADR